jgi:hypothetical protein
MQLQTSRMIRIEWFIWSGVQNKTRIAMELQHFNPKTGID